MGPINSNQTQDQDDNTQSTPLSTDSSPSNPPPSTFSADDIQNLFSQAQGDIGDARQNAMTSQDLQSLEGQAKGNMWAGMLMNLIGSANNVNMKNSVDTLNNNFRNQLGVAGLKNQISQQGLERAKAEQGLGIGQIGANQQLAQLQYLQSPINGIQKAIYKAYGNVSGQTLPELPDNTNQMQFNNAMEQLKVPTELAAELKKYGMMLGMKGRWGVDPKTGGYIWLPPAAGAPVGTALPPTGNFTQNTSPTDANTPDYSNASPGTHVKIDQNPYPFKNQGTQATQAVPQKTGITYNDLENGNNPYTGKQQNNALGQINGYAKDYMKEYGQPNIDFQNSINKVNSYLDDFAKGNFVGTRQIPMEEARVLGDLKGRLTNYDIEMQKNATSAGAYNSLQASLNGILGNGKMSSAEAKYIQKTLNDVNQYHNQAMAQAQNMYRTKAQQAAPGFNDDGYLFGSNPAAQNVQPQSTSAPSPSQYGSINDLVKKYKGQ